MVRAPGLRASTAELLTGLRSARARDVVVLPSDKDTRAVAEAAAVAARDNGQRVAVIPTRSIVQSLAAVAVHHADRWFDDDVIAMTRAGHAVRGVTTAVRDAMTTAGVCRPATSSASSTATSWRSATTSARSRARCSSGCWAAAASWSPSSSAPTRRRGWPSHRAAASTPGVEVDSVSTTGDSPAGRAHRRRVGASRCGVSSRSVLDGQSVKALRPVRGHDRRGAAAPLPPAVRRARRADRSGRAAGRRAGDGPGAPSSRQRPADRRKLHKLDVVVTDGPAG